MKEATPEIEFLPGDRIKSRYSEAVLVLIEYRGKHVVLQVEKTGITVIAEKMHLNGTNKFKKLTP